MKIKRRFFVPDDLKCRIATETDLIRGYIETGERWEAHKEPRVSLEARLEAAKSSGLFYPGIKSALQISNPALLAAQAEIARVHALTYCEDGQRSRWKVSESIKLEQAPLLGRTDNYLHRIIRSSEDKHIPKIDFALLAHCFQLPIRCWEAASYGTFEAYLGLAQKKDLFTPGTAFFDLFQCRSDGISVAEVPDTGQVAAVPGELKMRAVRTRATPKSVRSDRNVIFSLTVPHAFEGERVFALLMEEDATGAISLLSTEALVDHDPWFQDNIQIPRQSVVDLNKQSVALGLKGTSKLYCIISKIDLSRLPFYKRRVNEDSTQDDGLIQASDLTILRDTLLGLHPSSWTVVRSTLTIE